jgi:hypothetical protein
MIALDGAQIHGSKIGISWFKRFKELKPQQSCESPKNIYKKVSLLHTTFPQLLQLKSACDVQYTINSFPSWASKLDLQEGNGKETSG